MKPLELTVHPRSAIIWYSDCRRQRFTDAELAAEYWQANIAQLVDMPTQGHGWGGHGIRNEHITAAIHRFATTTSYDE